MTFQATSNELRKKLLDCRNFCISTDETRPHLQGVYHSESRQQAISCNGHIAFLGNSLYQLPLKGLIISKDQEIIDRDYPKMDSVVPTKFKDNCIFTLEKHHYRKEKIPVALYFHKSKDDSCHGTVSFEQKEGHSFAINAALLKPLCNGSSYQTYFNEALSPVIFKLDESDFKNIMLVMPYKV